MGSFDQRVYLSGGFNGPVTAVRSWNTTAEERRQALSPSEAHRIISGLRDGACRHQLVEVAKLALSTGGVSDWSRRRSSDLLAQVEEAFRRNQILFLPGWTWTRQVERPGEARTAGPEAPIARVAARIMAGRGEIPFEGCQYHVIPAESWADSSARNGFQRVPQDEARAILLRMAARMPPAADATAALHEAIVLLARNDSTGAPRRHLLLIRKALAISLATTRHEPALSSSQFRRAHAEAKLHWFEAVVVDEVGQPIAGLDLVFNHGGVDERSVTTGSGKARIDAVEATQASASIADVQALRDLLKPRWDKVRDAPTIGPKGDVVVWRLRDKLASLDLQHERPRTISIQPYVVRARLIGGYFDTSKSFLLPNGVDGVRGVVGMDHGNPKTTLLIVGHTDTASDSSYNDPLSIERAEATAAYLIGDVDAWYKWYGAETPNEKRWGKREDLAMIEALPDASDRDLTENPVRWFQRTRELEVDGVAGTATRHALIREYMALDGTSLPKGVEVVTHGCGENFPGNATGDGVADPNNRRVEIFFFDGKLGVQPKPPGRNSAKGSKEYPEWVARSGKPVDFLATDDAVSLEIEWAEDVLDQLPEYVSVVLTGDGLTPQTHFVGTADRQDGIGRISFGDLSPNQIITLTANGGDQELVLVRDQAVGDLGNPFVWEHQLDELLVPEEVEPGELVASSSPPADARIDSASNEREVLV